MKITILHGWSTDLDNHQKWDAFRAELRQEGIESEVLNIPGLSAPLDEVWNVTNYVEWLTNVLRDQKDIVLLGHSFGGQIAIRFTAANSEKVAKLILVDSAGIRDHSLKATLKRNIFFVFAKIGKMFFRSEMLRGMLYKVARERDYKNAPPLLRRTMSAILDDEVGEDLAKIMCPTEIIWGSEDKVTPLFLGKIFQKKIQNNEFHIVNGARHSPQFTHAKETAALVAKFVKEK